MLSKAEIRYLQGQKQISKSYGRNLRCLIRRKVEVLEKEIPLLSSLFGESIKFVFSEILNEKKLPSPPLKQKGNDGLAQYSSNEKGATESSNASLRDDGFKDVNIGAERQGLEGSKISSHQQNMREATDFGNIRDKNATKNSNLGSNQHRERDLNLWVIDEGSDNSSECQFRSI